MIYLRVEVSNELIKLESESKYDLLKELTDEKNHSPNKNYVCMLFPNFTKMINK